MSALPSAGFHYGVPFEDYRKWEAINYSTLKQMDPTPLHCRYAMDHPSPPTPAMVMGSALHICTFEPARFAKDFYIPRKVDRRTKEGKADFEAITKECGSRLILPQDEADAVEGMAASIRSFKTAGKLIALPGECEVSGLWQDDATGLWCKFRMDKWCPQIGTIVELKSTRDASRTGFYYEARNHKYFAQAQYYRTGVKAITGKLPNHAVIAVENEPPHATATHVFADALLLDGETQFRKWLEQYAECKRTGKWPGYPETFSPPLERPIWEN